MFFLALGGSWRLLTVLIDSVYFLVYHNILWWFLVVFLCFLWFLVVLGNCCWFLALFEWYLVVLSCSWWFLDFFFFFYLRCLLVVLGSSRWLLAVIRGKFLFLVIICGIFLIYIDFKSFLEVLHGFLPPRTKKN